MGGRRGKIPLSPPLLKGEQEDRRQRVGNPPQSPLLKGEQKDGRQAGKIPLSPPFSKGEDRGETGWC